MTRASLSAHRIVDTAITIADQHGAEHLTLSAVAAQLRVKTPSLYKHVDGLSGLTRLMRVRAKNELGAHLTHAIAGLTRLDALNALVRAAVTWSRQHPTMYRLSLAAADPAHLDDVEASQAALGAALLAVRGYDLDDEARTDAVRTLRALTHGFAQLDSEGGFAMERPVEDSLSWALQAMHESLSSP